MKIDFFLSLKNLSRFFQTIFEKKMTCDHAKINIACFVFALLVCSSLTITFVTLKYTTAVFTVDGTLQKIQTCYESCYTNGVDGGCINSTVVAFDWIYQNNTYNVTGFKCGFGVCGDCCVPFLNHTIQVEIDPKNPSLPIRFWTEDETPYSITYDMLGLVAGVCTYILLSISCVFLHNVFKQRQYEQMN